MAVINETMAKQYWKDGDPLKDRILIGSGQSMKELKDEPARQIVGIVGDVRDAGLESRSAAHHVRSAGATSGRDQCADCRG